MVMMPLHEISVWKTNTGDGENDAEDGGHYGNWDDDGCEY